MEILMGNNPIAKQSKIVSPWEFPSFSRLLAVKNKCNLIPFSMNLFHWSWQMRMHFGVWLCVHFWLSSDLAQNAIAMEISFFGWLVLHEKWTCNHNVKHSLLPLGKWKRVSERTVAIEPVGGNTGSVLFVIFHSPWWSHLHGIVSHQNFHFLLFVFQHDRRPCWSSGYT